MRTWGVATAALLLACSDGDSRPLLPAEALFMVQEESLLGHYAEGPEAWKHVEMQRIGDCALYVPPDGVCEPCDGACIGDWVCDAAQAAYRDIGPIRLTSTTVDVEIRGADDGLRVYFHSSEGSPLFAPGEPVTLTGGGEDGMPPFELTARGVPAVELAVPPVSGAPGEDREVAWIPADGPDGAEIVIHLANQHHGLPTYVQCRGPDDGSLVLPAALLAEVDAENAFAARVHRHRIALGDGSAELSVESWSYLEDLVTY